MQPHLQKVNDAETANPSPRQIEYLKRAILVSAYDKAKSQFGREKHRSLDEIYYGSLNQGPMLATELGTTVYDNNTRSESKRNKNGGRWHVPGSHRQSFSAWKQYILIG